MIYKINQTEADAIRSIARRVSGRKNVKLEIGTRYNIHSNIRAEANIMLVSDDPQWGDTDLFDFISWAEFRRGLELTQDGRGDVDIFVYENRLDGELLCNVTARFAGGRLVRAEGERYSMTGYNVNSAPVTWEASQ